MPSFNRVYLVVFLTALVAALMSFSAIDTQASLVVNGQPTGAVQFKIDPAPQDQVLALPEDGGKFHCSVLVHDNWRQIPGERAMVTEWFEQNKTLNQLAQQTWLHVYTQSDPVYRSHFASTVPAADLPAVFIQDGTQKGEVYLGVSGKDLPGDPDKYALMVAQCFRRRPAPPKPDGKPNVSPNTTVIVNPQPPAVDTEPSEEAADDKSTFLALLAVLTLVAGLATFGVKVVRDMQGVK